MASLRTRLAAFSPNGRNRLSAFWAPTGGITPTSSQENDPHALLIRAGFLRQAYSGVFHLLPLGLRVQDKLQNLIDYHMKSIAASKLSLSSISSSELWQKTGRLNEAASELLRIEDRRKAGYLLSPTHEEEITTLVKNTIRSYKDLPLRLYQIGRKYRDELRPRQGLLRAKEFVMKDLYSFDVTPEAAFTSYKEVTEAYKAFFAELQLPYVVAKADSGTMGGNVSHEYHFITRHGEDNIVRCSNCDYIANEEVAEKDAQRLSLPVVVSDRAALSTWIGITKDKKTLIIVFFPESTGESNASSCQGAVNPRSLVKIVPQIDLSIENAVHTWNTAKFDDPDVSRDILHVYDARLSSKSKERLIATNEESWIPSSLHEVHSKATSIRKITATDVHGLPIDLTRIKDGDHCRHCTDGKLRIQRGIEVGHTFYLGTRYSEPLNLVVSTPTQNAVPLQMGCHGIGISRLIGAVAAVMSGPRGLRWPRAIAPFDVVIITPPDNLHMEMDINWCYDALNAYKFEETGDIDRRFGYKSRDYENAIRPSGDERSLKASVPGEYYVDAVIDDRQKDIAWKLKDADLIGYPVFILLGRTWARDRVAEIKCPALGSDDLVPAHAIVEHVAELLVAYKEISQHKVP